MQVWKIGAYTKACGGDLSAGVLLQQMVFLHERSKFVRDGVRWYIRSRDQLMADTGLTKYKYDLAIKLLREAGYVITENAAKIGSNMAMQTTAFAVTEKALAALVEASNGSKSGNRLPDLQAIDGPTEQAIDGPDVQAIYKKKAEIKKTEMVAKSAPSSQVAAGPLTSTGVEKVFREEVRKSDPSYFHVAWGRKQQALAKQMVTKFGKDTGDVLMGCIAFWDDYRDLIRESTNSRVPQKPNLLTMLGYPSEAMKMAKRKHESSFTSKVDLGAIFANGGGDQ